METERIISWLRDKADRAADPSWGRMMKAAADRLEKLEEEKRWIPVEERMPDDGIIVLLSDGHHCDSGLYDADGDYFEIDHAFIDPNGVTQWKPFPEAP